MDDFATPNKDNVIKLETAPPSVNPDAIRLTEELLERLRIGEVIDVAFVAVHTAGRVATAWSAGNNYHRLNSGAARLASRLASDPENDDL